MLFSFVRSFKLSVCQPLMNDSSFKKKNILLVFPGKYKAPDPQIPLSLLHLASPLQRSGYSVRVFDMRIENYKDLAIDDPVFVGISTMSGLQIQFGLEFARKVREKNPSVPIVWGGVHPSLLPVQTIEDSNVDMVVRGEGDLVVSNLAETLYTGASLKKVKGLTYKEDGAIISNPDAELINLDEIPIELPFDLLKLDKYPALKKGRIHIQTSRGCSGL